MPYLFIAMESGYPVKQNHVFQCLLLAFIIVIKVVTDISGMLEKTIWLPARYRNMQHPGLRVLADKHVLLKESYM